MSFSPLMLGTAQFGLDYGVANASGKPSPETVREIIAYAWEHGVNCLDTAATYGDSESVVGAVLQELRLSGKMQIVSKVAHFPEDISAADVRNYIEKSVLESLRKLQVDYLDVCLFHHEKYFYAIESLAALCEKGLVQKIGVSFSGVNTDSAEKVLLSPLVDAMQFPGSVLDRRFENALNGLAQQRDIPLFMRSTYLQGLLLMEKAPSHLREMQPSLDKIGELARRFGISRETLCMGYVLGISNVCSVLVGVDNLAQLRENIALVGQGALDENTRRTIVDELPLLPAELLCPALWKKA